MIDDQLQPFSAAGTDPETTLEDTDLVEREAKRNANVAQLAAAALPDAEAQSKAIRLSRNKGITIPAAQARVKLSPESEWAELVKKHPVLAEHLAEDYQRAAALKDDVENLSAWDNLFKGWSDLYQTAPGEWERTGRMMEGGLLGWEAAMSADGQLSPAQQDRLRKLDAEDAADPSPRGQGWVTKNVMLGGAQMLAQQAGVARRHGTEINLAGVAGAAVGATTGAAASAPVGGIVGLPGAFAGYVAGIGSGLTAYGMTDNGMLEGGNFYREAVKIPGVTHQAAKAGALFVGMANGSIEAVEAKVFGLDKLVGNLAGKELRAGFIRAIKTQTGKGALLRFGQLVAEKTLMEAVQEGWQELNTIFELIRVDPATADQSVVRSVRDSFAAPDRDDPSRTNWNRISESMQAGAGMGLFGGGPHIVASTIPDAGNVGRSILQAKQRVRFFEAMGELSSESKVRQRLPVELRIYLDRLQKENGGKMPEAIKVPAGQLRAAFEAEGLTREFVEENLPGTAKQLDQAGEDAAFEVSVPVPEFAAHVAPLSSYKTLHQDLRVGDGMTLREATEAERIGKELEAAPPAGPEIGPPTPTEAVFQAVKRFSLDLGHSDAAANQQAALWAGAMEARAKRKGIDPFTYFESVGLTVQHTLVDSGQIEALGPAIEKRKAARAKARGKNEGAQPALAGKAPGEAAAAAEATVPLEAPNAATAATPEEHQAAAAYHAAKGRELLAAGDKKAGNRHLDAARRHAQARKGQQPSKVAQEASLRAGLDPAAAQKAEEAQAAQPEPVAAPTARQALPAPEKRPKRSKPAAPATKTALSPEELGTLDPGIQKAVMARRAAEASGHVPDVLPSSVTKAPVEAPAKPDLAKGAPKEQAAAEEPVTREEVQAVEDAQDVQAAAAEVLPERFDVAVVLTRDELAEAQRTGTLPDGIEGFVRPEDAQAAVVDDQDVVVSVSAVPADVTGAFDGKVLELTAVPVKRILAELAPAGQELATPSSGIVNRADKPLAGLKLARIDPSWSKEDKKATLTQFREATYELIGYEPWVQDLIRQAWNDRPDTLPRDPKALKTFLQHPPREIIEAQQQGRILQALTPKRAQIDAFESWAHGQVGKKLVLDWQKHVLKNPGGKGQQFTTYTVEVGPVRVELTPGWLELKDGEIVSKSRGIRGQWVAKIEGGPRLAGPQRIINDNGIDTIKRLVSGQIADWVSEHGVLQIRDVTDEVAARDAAQLGAAPLALPAAGETGKAEKGTPGNPITVALISCGDAKLEGTHKARDLYTSPLFKGTLALAEKTHDRVFILSGKHRLLRLDQEVESYDQKFKPSQDPMWGQVVSNSLTSGEDLSGKSVNVTIYAGSDYADAVAPKLPKEWKVEQPMAGMQIGQRLSFLKKQREAAPAEVAAPAAPVQAPVATTRDRWDEERAAAIAKGEGWTPNGQAVPEWVLEVTGLPNEAAIVRKYGQDVYFEKPVDPAVAKRQKELDQARANLNEALDLYDSLKESGKKGTQFSIALEAARVDMEAAAEELQRLESGKVDQELVGVNAELGSEGVMITPPFPEGEPVRYAIIRPGDLYPSHRPSSFLPTAAYPSGVQERDYSGQPAEQAKVVNGARELNPTLLLTDTPSAVDGPPVVTAQDADGRHFVMGGNGRTMMLLRAQEDHPKKFEAYQKALKAKAAAFGFDPAKIPANGILVRVLPQLRASATKAELQAAVKRTNEGMQNTIAPENLALSQARALSETTISGIANVMAQEAADKTLRFTLDHASSTIVPLLQADGIITDQNRADWLGGAGNKQLTGPAKDRIEAMFVGRVLGTAERLGGLEGTGLRAKIERIVAPLIRVEGINPEVSEIPTVQAAVDQIIQATTRGITLDEQMNQIDFEHPKPPTPAVMAMARLLEGTGQVELGKRFKAWSGVAGQDPNQGSMFGTDPRSARAELLGPEASVKTLLQPVKKPEPKNLLVQHNITPRKLLEADKLGGFAMPSIAVSRVEHPMTSFGEITLLADPGVINPRTTPVFNADVYSPVHPHPRYKLRRKEFNEAKRWLAPYAERTMEDNLQEEELSRNGIKEIVRMAVDGGRNIGLPLRLAYVEEVLGKHIPDQRKLYQPSTDLLGTEALASFVEDRGNLEGNFPVDGDYHHALTKALLAGVEELAMENDDPLDQAAYRKSLLRRLFGGAWSSGVVLDYTPGDLVPMGRAEALLREFPKMHTMASDPQAMSDEIDRAFRPRDEGELRSFIEGKIGGILADPYIRVDWDNSGDEIRLPYNLANIIKTMKKAGVVGGEGTSSGLGMVRAHAAKRFRSVSEMQAARDTIVDQDVEHLLLEDLGQRLSDLGDEIGYSAQGFGDFLIQAYKFGLEGALELEGTLGAALINREGTPWMERVQKFMDDLAAAPTEYFEAKPTRAVTLKEFTAAVIPADLELTYPQAVQALTRAGLKLYTYQGRTGSETWETVGLRRSRAIAHAAGTEKVLFQSDREKLGPAMVVELKQAANQDRILEAVIRQEARIHQVQQMGVNVSIPLVPGTRPLKQAWEEIVGQLNVLGVGRWVAAVAPEKALEVAQVVRPARMQLIGLRASSKEFKELAAKIAAVAPEVELVTQRMDSGFQKQADLFQAGSSSSAFSVVVQGDHFTIEERNGSGELVGRVGWFPRTAQGKAQAVQTAEERNLEAQSRPAPAAAAPAAESPKKQMSLFQGKARADGEELQLEPMAESTKEAIRTRPETTKLPLGWTKSGRGKDAIYQHPTGWLLEREANGEGWSLFGPDGRAVGTGAMDGRRDEWAWPTRAAAWGYLDLAQLRGWRPEQATVSADQFALFQGSPKLTPEDAQVAMATSRAGGAVGAHALVPRLAAAELDKSKPLLDFGAGKAALHAAQLRADGFDVTAYDLWNVPGLHDPLALKKKWPQIIASNVLNVENSRAALAYTLDQLRDAMEPDGVGIFNLPATPRKGAFDGLTPAEGAAMVERELKARFGKVTREAGATPIFRVSVPLLTAAATPDQMGLLEGDKQLRLLQGPGPGKAAPAGEQYRGKVDYDEATRTWFKITLTKRANLSTFLHESGHVFLELMRREAAAGEQATKDELEVLGKWAGVQGGKWTDEQLETFARGFEAYLMEGKAPSSRLAEAFQSFAAWLTHVYKSIRGLDVELTDEVRQVMDRMVATDEAIEAAKKANLMLPMFGEATGESGVTGQEYEAIRQKWNAGIEAGRQALQREIMRDLKRDVSAEANQLRAEETEKLAARADFNAWEWLTTGKRLDGAEVETPHQKLDLQAVRDLGLPQGELKKLKAVMVEGGLDLEAAAAIFGFGSGRELVDNLVALPTKARAVETAVHAEMSDRYAGYDPSTRWLAEKANERLNNLSVQDALLEELKVLTRKTGGTLETPGKSLLEGIRAAAKKRVAGLTGIELDPWKYRNEAAKAGQARQLAYGKGQLEEAAQAARKQLWNLEMEKQVQEAKEKVGKIRSYLESFNHVDVRKQIGKAGANFLGAIDALLDGIQFRKRSAKAIQRKLSLADYLARVEAEGGLVTIPDELRAEAELRNYRELTYEELQGVEAAVSNLETQARLKNKIKFKREQANFQELAGKLATSIREKAGLAPESPNQNPSAWEKSQRWLRKGRASLRKIEFLARMLDGGETAGFFHQAVFQPMRDAENAEQRLNREIMEVLLEPFVKLTVKDRLRLERRVDFFGKQMRLSDVLAAALNVGNEGNFSKLVEGYLHRGMTQEKVMARLDELLEKSDWDLVQHTWDTIELLWPAIKQLQERTVGLGPVKVEPRTVVTRHGNYRGGYYPVVYDPAQLPELRLDSKGNPVSVKDAAQMQESKDLFENNFLLPNVSKGFTQTRTKYAAPIQLSLDLAPKHIKEVIHFLTHYEAVRDVDRLIQHPDVKDAIWKTVGREEFALFRPWLQAIANDGALNVADAVDDTLRHLRVGSSVVLLGAKITTGLVQVFGLFPTVKEIGWGHTASGIKLFLEKIGHGENPFTEAEQESEEILFLTRHFDRDVGALFDAQVNAWGVTSRFQERMATFSLAWIMLVQKTVNVMTWYGAREAALEARHENPTAFADSVVSLTQSSAGIKDLAAIQRGPETKKLFTVMYTYFNVLFNQLFEGTSRKKAMSEKLPLYAARFFYMVLLPVLAETLLRNRKPEKEDDKEWAKLLVRENLTYMARSIPLFGSVSEAYFNERSARVNPWLDALIKGSQAAGKGQRHGKLSDAQRRALVDLLGMVTKTPTGGFYNASKFLHEYQNGHLDEPLQDLLFRGPRDWE